MRSLTYPHKKKLHAVISGWPLFQRQVSVLDRMPNPVLWQIFIEEPLDLVVEVRRSPILLQNEVVGVF
jgi:hypothetical protein